MRLQPVSAAVQIPAEGEEGLFCLGDVREALPGLIERYGGQAQVVYADPPFASGQTFQMRVFVGEEDWRKGAGSLAREAYADPSDREAAESLLRALAEGAKALLREDGLFFLHVDWRLSGRARRVLDEVFCEDHIVNEIVWAYQTGGRARRYFSRKHDSIFMYRKGEEYLFDIDAVAVRREGARRNHMRRQVDADGRAYRTIRSGGKIYTYYDDEPALPGDVWDDINMQQKDPQRTGFETQKPLKLLERIILCSTRPGDLAVDLCTGSGTGMEAAWRAGRRFVGVDKSPMALLATRRRLMGAALRVEGETGETDLGTEVRLLSGSIGEWGVELIGIDGEREGVSGMDMIDSWGLGYLRGGAYTEYAREQRSRARPALQGRLFVPVYEGELAVRLSDVFGRTGIYLVNTTKLEYEA